MISDERDKWIVAELEENAGRTGGRRLNADRTTRS